MIQFVCLSIHRSVRSRSVVKGKHWLMVIITDQHLQVAKNLLVQDVHYFVAQSYALKEGFSWCTNPCYLLRSTKIIICRPKKKYLNNQDCHRLCVARLFMVSYMESSRHIKQSIFSVDAAQLNRFRGNVGLIPNCRLWLIPKKGISHVTYCAIFPFQSGAK